MIRLVPCLVVVAALTTSAPARAGEPCQRAVTIRDGKPFDPKVASAPGFDPKTAPTVPWCDGDELPTSEVLRLIEIEDRHRVTQSALELAEDRLRIERAGRASDKIEFGAMLAACDKSRLACEAARAPPPDSRPRPKAMYERPVVWAGVALAVTSVVVGISTASEHPAIYAAGGAGLGMVIAGGF